MPSDERCDWSDMPVSDCQHCKDGKKELGKTGTEKGGWAKAKTRDYSSGDSPVVLAQFSYPCGLCGLTIFKNEDMIIKLDGKWVHERHGKEKAR